MAEKRKGEQRKRSSVDWQAIEHEYVTGGDNVSQRYLANAHQVSLTSVQKACSRGGWVQKREDHRGNVKEIALEASADQLADDISAGNLALGRDWYKLAAQALQRALTAEKPSEQHQLAVAAGIATDKWRLVTGQNTAKTAQEHSGTVSSEHWWAGMEEAVEGDSTADGDQ